MDILNKIGKNRFYHSRETGQSAVEFALVLPLLIIMLLGIVQFGFILNGLVVVNAAAREGARALAVGEGGDAATVAAEDVCSYALLAGSCGASNGEGMTLSATSVMRKEDGSGDPIPPFTYTVTVPIILPFLGGGGGNP